MNPTTAAFLAIALVGGTLVSPPTSAATPESERAAFRIPKGFDIRVFADEDNGVVKPIQSRFDARGRLWIVGSTVYPHIQPGQVPDDKVVIVEDTDGDGRADKTTVFAEGLFIPTGIELTEDGCLVGNSTELLRLRDTDGDGKADVREVVLRGFGTGDNHQNLNSFQWSPSGELWFSQGLHANSRVETPWGIVKLEHAGIWRLRPRRLQLDAFFGNELPPHNPWGFVFDDWGGMLVLAGNGHGIYDPLPIALPGHAVRPLDQVWRDSRGRKICGGDICGNAHFPERWQGVMFAGGFMNNTVYTLKIERDGAIFRVDDITFGTEEVGPPPGSALPAPDAATGTRQVNDATVPAPGIGSRLPFISSTLTSFRPVDVKFGPDGALYLTDWSNPIIGHYQTSFRHPDRDKTHGRIWRITAEGRAPVKQPVLVASTSGAKVTPVPAPILLDHLKSNDRFTRLQARRLLSASDPAAVAIALPPWIAGLDPQDPRLEHHLFEALGIYEDHEAIGTDILLRLLQAKDPRARAAAVQAVARWADRLPDPLALLKPRLRDDDLRVRLAAVNACGYVKSAASLATALEVLDDPAPGSAGGVGPADRFLDYALRQVIFVLKPHWLPAFRESQLGLTAHPNRLQFLVTADASPDTIGVVRSLVDRLDMTAATRETLLSVLAESGTAADYTHLLETAPYMEAGRLDVARQVRVLKRLEAASRARGTRPTADAPTRLQELWKRGDRDLSLATLRLATLWKLQALDPSVLATTAANPSDDELAAAGATALALTTGEAARPLLEAMSRPERPLAEQVSAALGTLAVDLTNGVRLAAGILASDAAGRSAIRLLPSVFARTGGSALLGTALESTPPTRDAARIGLRWMQTSGVSQSNLVARLTHAAQLDAEPLKATPAFIAELAVEVRSSGDAERGREIFRRTDLNCLACHNVGGEGGTIGPDLNAIGSGQPLDFIIGAVLEPNKEVKENYEAIEVTTRDGETYVGYRVKTGNEAEFTLRDTSRNEIVRLRRESVAQVTQRGSVMPAGLVDGLARAELRDLFKYLSGLGRAGK